MAKKSKKDNALAELIAAAPPRALSELILALAADSPEVRRECFDYLKENKAVSKMLKSQSEGEAILSIWAELLPDLEDLDAYGGGPYGVEDNVWELLYEITQRLNSKKVDETCRREILDAALPFIKSGNAGAGDALDELAYAACYTDTELRYMAERLEAMHDDWQTRNARNIYRQIGDHEKYLELRLKRMEVGADYHDLAEFYWETGEKEKSIQIAQKGLKAAKGRMDELRAFAADRAEESGDRNTWLALQFDQTTDRMTLDKYQKFKTMCTAEEWEQYEPKVLKKLKDAGSTEKMKIYMDRKEYENVMTILEKDRYPIYDWDSSTIVRIAEKLEKRYPEKLLKWYLSGLGNLSSSQNRKEYARKAGVMAKVRHMLVDVIKDEGRWKKLAVKVKKDNLRRPAFQQEFARTVPGWAELSE
ncbi:MAG: hypothetical protein SWH61_17405 [Thermodesulfobacteriota bacterium]|nr:hypothetical protein [Thermodesulfobacteriota bacterium]